MTTTEARPDVPQAEAGVASEAEAFAGRVFESTVAAAEVLMLYVGERLGLYRALADGGPATSTELAQRAGIHERYAREWLEQQATAGTLEVPEPNADPGQRRYAFPAAHAEVLLDGDSLNFLGPVARLVVGASLQIPALIEAYRTGEGVPMAQYGPDMVTGQADLNRPLFLGPLVTEWLPSIVDVHERLSSSAEPRVADIAAGGAWSSIGIARAYERVRVDAFDLDPASVALAERNIREQGLADRVTVHLQDATDATLVGRYDLVTILEALHDMSRPVDALRTARRLIGEGGAVVIMDERTAEEFEPATQDPVERFLYAVSMLACLPMSMAEQPSAATGTVIRPATVDRYAREAGFERVEVLPIEHLFFRLYRLHP
ncbi:MAG: methyltransferase domain-containing protein [Dehalococcoidia bacterium]|nr:methyltransferase domain-containing protein [Dehalococcoidia bacterium]